MNPPYRVLARVGRYKETRWYHWREPLGHFISASGQWYKASELKPVDHPKNDLEAIAIIEQSKKTRSKLSDPK